MKAGKRGGRGRGVQIVPLKRHKVKPRRRRKNIINNHKNNIESHNFSEKVTSNLPLVSYLRYSKYLKSFKLLLDIKPCRFSKIKEKLLSQNIKECILSMQDYFLKKLTYCLNRATEYCTCRL